ncbi:MoxR family ATPase [Fulvivirga kasyanovii]|uniref:MoxR family ATPase n=1 Tax=Fulvivirga kasyanovii TaxID=396812 RepID=A0ABW9RV91_9BACT|nr:MULTISPECIES: MoxR family ATPase [Fulvivirga]MTI27626.1 MoxR family ATPase [Fulvivirga kasyanovii]UII29667.1 MoxR family ATPase [Fulvivirga ulvae]
MAETSHWTGSDKYLCDPALAQAFHMARVLGMPLLIEGEPGTGKTDLPIHYAKDRGLDLEVYPVGSKSNIEQFVARFDHVKYLRDSQIEILNAQREEKGLASKLTTGERNPETLADYVVKGPAAVAYSKPNSVLLIDEIDKAPREFPNDLLYALSHRKFIMPESGEIIETSEKDMPAIVITSNREQELPTAFKGRCIYHYIDFPDKEVMAKIIEKHHPGMDEKVVRVALDVFYHLRRLGLERAPTTREILNWLKYMGDIAPKEAVKKIEGLEGIGALIKTQTDMERVSRMLGANNATFGGLN